MQSASYDLRLGNEYYIPLNKRPEGCNALSCPYPPQNDIMKCSDENGVLKIPKFSTVVFSTEEILKIPNNVVGRFDLRIRFALQGLVLQVGTQVEPGYNGRLFGLLLNFSDKEICIPKGKALLTIEFNYTTSPVKIKEQGEEGEYKSLEKFIKHFPPTQGTLESFLNNIQTIQNKVETQITKIEERKSRRILTTISWIIGAAGVLGTIFMPLTVLHITKSTIDKDDYPFEKIIQVEKENESLKSEKDSLERKVLKLNDQMNCKNDSLKQEMSSMKEQIQKLNKNK
ncbi:hypothetical protein FACS189411_15830 [Bacteroidia bacterium]|nr:hypothetical protein FACS189411_15830 [Bacteroidia bacterium]